MGNVATAKDFLVNYLPENVIEHIDVSTLEIQKDSFINSELDENFSDLLFKADIHEQEGYIYFIFEHKSYRDKGIAFQLLKYMVEIWEAKMKKEGGKELPIIIPLVMYHGRENWRIHSSLGAMLNGYETLPENLKVFVPNFEYQFYDISRFSDEEIKGRAQLRILLTLFRDIHTKEIEELHSTIRKSIYYLNELEDKQTGIEYLETMIKYVFSVGNHLTKTDMKQIVLEIERIYPEGSDVAMTLADMLREEGREEGRKEGMEAGATAALAETAIQQLIERFGKMPEDIKDGIQRLDTVALKPLLFNIFRYENIDDVRKYI